MTKSEMQNKIDKLKMTIALLATICFIQLIIAFINKGVIDDLVATTNGYKSDKNICKMQLEEFKRDYEILQNEK